MARISLLKLIADGRIHPARIEDVVKKVEQEVDLAIKEAGEQAAFDLGVHGIHNELIKYIGRLKFRTSYSQNVLQHSVEVGFLTGVMAAELNLNQKIAKRMGLLHDLGKAMDHEHEGTHSDLHGHLLHLAALHSASISSHAPGWLMCCAFRKSFRYLLKSIEVDNEFRHMGVGRVMMAFLIPRLLSDIITHPHNLCGVDVSNCLVGG